MVHDKVVTLTRPQSSSPDRRARRERGVMGREKGGRLSHPRFPSSHHTPRTTKEKQRERQLGTSQVVAYGRLSICGKNQENKLKPN